MLYALCAIKLAAHNVHAPHDDTQFGQRGMNHTVLHDELLGEHNHMGGGIMVEPYLQPVYKQLCDVKEHLDMLCNHTLYKVKHYHHVMLLHICDDIKIV